jgi:serine/threonine protein kinase
MKGAIIRDRYRIIKQISADAFEETYLAEDMYLPDNPLCIVKRLNLINVDPKKIKEVKTISKIDENLQIPKLLGHFKEDGAFYWIEEFIEGHRLSEELQSVVRFSEGEVFFLLHDVLSSLQYLHNLNLIHRNIKPDNLIRRDRDNKFVLVGFNIFKQFSLYNKNLHDRDRGYIPPEQLSREKFIYQSVDIFALGMVAIYALTGISPEQLPRDLCTGDVLWRNEVLVSNKLARFLDKMVHYDPQQRYSSATEALKELKELISNKTVSKKTGIWDKGNRAIALASGGAFLGSFIAQAPGAIIGAIAGIIFGFLAKVDEVS